MSQRRTKRIAVIALAVLGVAVFVLSCCAGSSGIGFADFFDLLWKRIAGEEVSSNAAMILFGLRMPRAVLSFVVGGALAICGAVMQAMFRNPMAEPHILGVSSGAGLGATLVIVAGLDSGLALSGAAFVGGLAAVVFVYLFSRVRGRLTTVTLLLAGIALSTLLTSLISALMIFDLNKLEKITLWIMGSFSTSSWKEAALATPVVLVSGGACLFFSRDLNLMLMGDEQARHLGVDTGLVRKVLMAATALCVSAAVSVSGIIGFVGLLVPHVMRLLTGPDHRTLLPLSFAGGGIFLMLADLLARTLAAPRELPVGVLTAFCGVPFFLYLLRRRSA